MNQIKEQKETHGSLIFLFGVAFYFLISYIEQVVHRNNSLAKIFFRLKAKEYRILNF